MFDGAVRTLENVRHVPEMTKGLIYLPTLSSEGYKFSGCDGFGISLDYSYSRNDRAYIFYEISYETIYDRVSYLSYVICAYERDDIRKSGC